MYTEYASLGFHLGRINNLYMIRMRDVGTFFMSHKMRVKYYKKLRKKSQGR